jgi:excisionase family DNA binding protein
MNKTKKRTSRARRGKQLATQTDVVVGSSATDDALIGALKIHQAARYVSLSPPTLRRLVERGLIRPNRATRHLIFSVAELNRFLAQGQAE